MRKTTITPPYRGIPLTRAIGIKPFEDFLRDIGAPYAHYLRKAHIPEHLTEHLDSPVPSLSCYRMIEIASRTEGIENLGLVIAERTGLDDIGAYGQMLLKSTTVYDYLSRGIRLLNTHTTGEKFWIEETEDDLRFCQWTVGGSSLGQQQASLYTLSITINTLRAVAGSGWSPKELSLQSEITKVPVTVSLANTQIMPSEGYSYFTFPRKFLALPFRLPGANQTYTADQSQIKLEEDLTFSVMQFIQLMLPYGYPDINFAVEAAGLSKRTFQRQLNAAGTSYSALVEDVRIRLACDWLESSDMPITEISMALAYSDVANFIHAFRRRTGVSPKAYRDNINSTTYFS